jgi:hypothetical protein
MGNEQRQQHDALLADAEARGWRVKYGQGYPMILCPCPEKHRETVHLTPSSRYYFRNKRRYLERYTCWEA